MERIKLQHPLAGNNAVSTAALRTDFSAAAKGQDLGQTSWKVQRRHECSPLSGRIQSLLEAMTGDPCFVRRGVLLEHAPGTLNPVTWLDCLAVTPFGVFVVDQYDWTGTVTRSSSEEEVVLHEKPGVVSIQTSPLRRAKPALRYLRSVVGHCGCPVESIAVFADSSCTLDPALPVNLLQAIELRHFMRSRLNQFRDSHARFAAAANIAANLQSRTADWGEGG
ncbi:NERD domain-containing protein [Paraburkholderia graminis]|uniref:NERD domain-containing protein n=1 Tax=Paraburkholderia graminis (strain ATCC 700544 / DSM 17151 / LMG 18924 / NCIMB 13744 / C4D1M) TaxID=396598 RepID=B1FXJ5_PARG4|nr:nuclease-related domain-containing protein [Paraburkholderia graminis]AXF07081.1 NERD domain-containing protein [Paraburkholderia graminis]EDT11538.1 hypothetical protein BgramDRAFT_2063 [Paraburkholderia graminis C4D1M]CAB3670317.1 hypothetical protein R8871_01975 [Paraburkholderia graminis C4D1M]